MIEVDLIGDYQLDDVPHPLVFTARYLEDGSGISVEQLVLTYEVVLNEALSELIDFGALRTGVWVNDIETSITPTWKTNKNPTNMTEYNAIKDNLSSYQMRVILRDEVITASSPKPTSFGFVLDSGVTNGIALDIGQAINVDANVYDQDGNIIPYLHPTINLVSGDSATYENGILSAISPENDETLVYSYPGLEDFTFNFTIKAPLSEF